MGSSLTPLRVFVLVASVALCVTAKLAKQLIAERINILMVSASRVRIAFTGESQYTLSSTGHALDIHASLVKPCQNHKISTCLIESIFSINGEK